MSRMSIKTVFVAFAIAVVGAAAMQPVNTAALPGVSGTVMDRAQLPLAGFAVPLRNIDTGEIVGRTVTDKAGQFSFSGLRAGQYIAEVVAPSGDLLAASAPINPAQSTNPLVLSAAVDGRPSFLNTPVAALIALPPIAGQVVRAAVLAGVTGNSIRVHHSNNVSVGNGKDNKKDNNGSVGNGKDRDHDTDTDKKSKSPKKPKKGKDSDSDHKRR